jgi:hypothetical protein
MKLEQRPRMPFALKRPHRVTALVLLTFATLAATSASLAAQGFPTKLSDGTFWKMVTDISESNGYFRSDNFVSNETMYQWVIPELQRTTKPGGVYLGVGPDQNFTYLVALKPKIAFIFDIRRQNMLTHLMYKALLEQSADRGDFVSRLFARQRPTGLDSTSTPEVLFAAFATVPPDSALYRTTLASIKDRLIRQHHFTLSDEDVATLTYVYNAFFQAGPGINYNYSQDRPSFRGRMPGFVEIQVATDSDHVHRSYLATEVNYRSLREMEANNLVVPVVGDFAGPKAIRAVGTYLKEHSAVVTAFYLSNVEQYLFMGNDNWRRFYENVGTLPLDSSSTFIRSVFTGGVYRGGGGSVMRGQQMLASMIGQWRMFNDGKLTSYYDVIASSR